MRDQECWNCKSDREPVRSAVTDMSYCISCGAIVVGRRTGTAHDGPGADQNETSAAGEGVQVGS